MLETRSSSVIARAVVSAGLVTSYIWAFWGQHEGIGGSMQVNRGATSVSGGTNPQAIVMSLAGVLFYLIVVKTRVTEHRYLVAPMWKRGTAFLVDFWFCSFTLGALVGCADVFMEESRTGVFQWHFQRDYSVPSDNILVVLVLASLAATVGYFLLPLVCGGQTVGCWLLRLATINSEGYTVTLPLKTAAWRLFLEFRGLCSPFRTLRKKDAQGRTFYDVESGFTVVCY
jgi:RDD family